MNAANLKAYLPGVVLLALCIPGWMVDATLFWSVYLAAWWFCLGLSLGALSNVWIHNLTGGAWGEPLRAPMLAMARLMPLLALLFVPLLFAMHDLWPWAAHAGEGASRWSGETSSPHFKRMWLEPWFFTARSIVYLAIWIVLELVSRSDRYSRSRPWSAAALIVYWMSASFAAMDWLMSLMPLWYSTAFPPLAVTGQMLTGFAGGALAAALRAKARSPVFRDHGNLLLVYVLCWAYLAFTQYLIIWAENLPHEIGWYVARLHTSWYWAGWLLITCHFFLPLLILLSRSAKSAPYTIAALSGGLLVLHLIDVWWVIVPSVRPGTAHVLWLGPLAAVAIVLLVTAPLRSRRGALAHG